MSIPALAEIARRLKSHRGTKLALSGILTAVFYAGYFGLQRCPLFPARLIGTSALDRAIPFEPRWTPVYLSLTILLPIAPWLMDSRDQVRDYCRALLAIMLVAFGFFFIWPTHCTRPPLLADTWHILASLREVDRDLNAFPSLHAAFALYSALCCNRVFKAMGDRGWVRAVLWLWTVQILYATLATKQHMAVDLLSGGGLGLIGYGLFMGLSGHRQKGRPA